MNRQVEMPHARRSLGRGFYLFTTLVLLSIPLVCLIGCPKDTTPPITTNQGGTNPPPPPPSVDTGRRKDAGHLKADRLFHDFGKVDKNQKLETSFELTNDGKETLKIGEIIPTCKCVLAPLETKVLEPGQSVTLSVTFLTPAQPGPSNQSVKIYPEKPSLPVILVLRLYAEVKRYITVEPPQFEIEMSKKEQPVIALKVSSTDEKPFRILSYRSRDKAVQLVFDKTKSAPVHTIPIQVDRDKLDPTLRVGVITLQMDHPKSRTYSIRYNLIPPYVAHPSTRQFHNLKPGKKAQATLTITSNFKEPFELGEVTSDEGLVQVKNIKKITNGYELLLEMQYPKDSNILRPRDFLNIKIKNEPKNSLRILCYAL
jgi:Protein of unknown function (DUF1573)